MVHELFNEDLGILTPQLKGPYGLEQLLAMTSVRTWQRRLSRGATLWRLYAQTFTKYASSNYTHQFPVPPEPSV